MGQSSSRNALSSHTASERPKCFSDEEMNNLKLLFDQLARRSPNATVDLEHFLEFFATLPGLHGEQLFASFDTGGKGVLDFDEFVLGMAKATRGTRHQKIKLLFDMYDLHRDGSVSQAELRALVNHLPRRELDGAATTSRRERGGASPGAAEPDVATPRAGGGGRRKRRSFLDFTNDDVADAAFEALDADHDGRLDLAQFERWVDATPGVLEFLDYALAKATSYGGALRYNGSSGDLEALSPGASPLHLESAEGADAMRGYLRKKGATTGATATRYFRLINNILYYFKDEVIEGVAPRGLVFLGGCQCEAFEEGLEFGFRVVHWDAERLGERPTTLYAADEAERDAWAAAIRAAIGGDREQATVEEHYDLGRVLGAGAFASVYEAADKATGAKVAVKHVEKGDKDDDEARESRTMCRREIALMRLANHKHVLPLLAVFEDRARIHIILPYHVGDLRARLERTRTFGPRDALMVCQKVFDAVAYLHQLGIAHRDLKAENVLCDDDETYNSIRIADFGVAQVLRPAEVLDDCKGTIEYCAPEVFLRKGAGFKADVWSVGVIGYYVLFGKLPFLGDRKAETIGYILEAEIPDADWSNVDDDVEDLFTHQVLVVDPEARITAKEALAHPWIHPTMERSSTVTSRPSVAPDAATKSWFPADLILPTKNLM